MTHLRLLTVGGILLAGCWLATVSNAAVSNTAAAEPLPGTKLLEIQGDVAEQMVAGIDRFLLGEIDKSIERRPRHWKRDVSSTANYTAALEPNRQRLAKIIGAVDPRTANIAIEYVATTSHPALVGRGEQFEVFAVRWPALRGVTGEGLLLVPTRTATNDAKGTSTIDIIAIPDADQTPEMLAGLMPGIEPGSQFARRLAESGCRVLIPALIDRSSTYSAAASGTRPNNQPGREFLYRPAFELGRHIIGYEVQKILAAVDWFAVHSADQNRPLGVAGYGEGGLLALDCAALDPRIDAALVSGHFDSRQQVWQEPIYRNVQGLLDQFGDAELAAMIAPRALVIEACRGPEISGPPAAKPGQSANAAPGRLATPKLASVQAEVDRARKLVAGVQPLPVLELVAAGGGDGAPGNDAALGSFLQALAAGAKLSAAGGSPTHLRKDFDPQPRLKRQFEQIAADTQHLLRVSENVRNEFWKKADRQARSADRWQQSTREYRDHFYNEVIGRFDQPLVDPKPRTRVLYDEPKWTGYEVQLDVFPSSAGSGQVDVFAYGILLLPKDIKPGEKRPVVVCQHGLEGRPTDVADPKADHPAYHRYAARLADEGFIVYAPQNPYIFGDKFRTLQRKANPLGKQLYSIIVPQHDQTVRWLATLPQVDPQRIAFYGLSYGGKTAMRVPAILEQYCLSICSADFNEWVWKNASLSSPYSYVGTGEYEIFEFDLGSTFNYAEMAGLIAPRPFMVERGHRDGVGPDTEVAYEYAKIRLLYADLKIPQRTEIEFFDGPHTINGVGTFAFLRKHLNWPAK